MTVTVVAVPSMDTSVEAAPTTHCVVNPSRLISTVVLSVNVTSTEVPERVSEIVEPETVTSRDVESPATSAVHTVVVPGTVTAVDAAVKST